MQDHLAELGRIIQRAEGPASRRTDPPAQPQNTGMGHLLPHLCESSRLRAARSSRLGKAPPLGTPTTSKQIHGLGHPAVLASAWTPVWPLPPRPPALTPCPSTPIVRWRSRGMSRSQGNRSPYDGDWVYWSTRQGRHPDASPRLARLLKEQQGRCRYCGLFFQHDDRIEVDHINGDRRRCALCAICKRCMDTAMMRKRGSMGTISRQVCVTSIRILRSGVTETGMLRSGAAVGGVIRLPTVTECDFSGIVSEEKGG